MIAVLARRGAMGRTRSAKAIAEARCLLGASMKASAMSAYLRGGSCRLGQGFCLWCAEV